MKTLTLKIITIILLFSLLLVNSSFVFAINPNDYQPTVLKPDDTATLFAKAGPVIKIIRNFGILFSALALTFVGLQYILGSTTEQKAAIKEKILPLILGGLLVVGTFTIVDAIISITNNLN